MDLTNLTFSEVPVPERARTTGPNPFTDVIGALSVGGPARKFAVPGGSDEKENAELREVVRLLRAAGKDRDLTTRIKVTEAGTKKEPAVSVMFWVVDRITRPRKETDTVTESNPHAEVESAEASADAT